MGNVALLPPRTEEYLKASREILAGPYAGRPNPKGWRTIVRAVRDKHSHQDSFAMTENAIIHMKCNDDGAGLCMDDVHGYIGQGEVAFDGIGCYARVQVRVEKSNTWYVDWPVIETPDEIMVFQSFTSTIPDRPQLDYVDLIRGAYREMRKIVAEKINSNIETANSIVATAIDIKNCAVYGLGDYIQKDGKQGQAHYDLAIVGCIPKSIFID